MRPATVDDCVALHAVFTQPGVRRFIFDGKTLTPEQTADIVRTSRESFERRRFGLWVARFHEDAEIVGFGALWEFRDPPELELLYGVSDTRVKNGYGREIAAAVVDYAFTRLEMPVVRASTDAENADSRRLLDVLGFVFERRAIVGGLDTLFYARFRGSEVPGFRGSGVQGSEVQGF